MPLIKRQEHKDIELIAFHGKQDQDKYAHFFLDDYQFERVWNKPGKYLNKAKQFKGMLTPDFSLYSDYPIAVQIWNTYRNRWCGQYWQDNDIPVIPTIGWSTQESYDFCFNGIEKGCTVAISNIGTINDTEQTELFYNGYKELQKRIKPTQTILYGYTPLDDLDVIFIQNRRFK